MEYTKENLVTILNENSEVEVTFTKKSTGTERVMRCTLNKDVLAGAGMLNGSPKPERKTPEHLVHVYDLDVGAWRSFDINTVTVVKF